MTHAERLLPRLIATVVLLLSVSMLVPLGSAVAGLAGGAALPMLRLAIPLAILAAGAVLISMLGRRQVPMRLYGLALALWLAAGVYSWYAFLSQ